MTPAGTAALVRLVVRRDRVRLTVWVVSIVALVAVSAISVIDLYPDASSLAQAAANLRGNRAVLAMNGPAVALDTLGGRVAFEIGAFGHVIVGLMNVFLVGRHTRGDEEGGTSELVRSAAVDPRSPIVATLTVALAANVTIAVASAVALVATDLPVSGSAAFCASLAATGLTFAALTLVAAQVTAHTRAVYGIACGALALAYVVRAVGDAGISWLSWTSPIGWGQAVRAYGQERWWVLLLPIVASALCLAGATALGRRRDHGAGLLPPRHGPARAVPDLERPLRLSWRLQRAAVLGWATGLFLGGLAYGSVAKDIDDYVRENPDLADFLTPGGGSLVDAYLGTVAMLLAVVAGGQIVQSVLRLRAEETSGRLEPLLATTLERRRWAAGGLAIALGSSALTVASAGLGTGTAYALSIRDAGQVGRVTAATLVQLPAVWALGGLAFALVGVRPRAAVAAWGLLALCAVVAMLGDLFGLPQVIQSLSPFEHLPRAPGAGVRLVPVVAVTAVAALASSIGFAGLRRRDIG